ncbi:hypothetical protein F2P79_015253 [Pimephales promelas]|nr:hypothetical protein F2P79_015253 [Pimephales promelas]
MKRAAAQTHWSDGDDAHAQFGSKHQPDNHLSLFIHGNGHCPSCGSETDWTVDLLNNNIIRVRRLLQIKVIDGISSRRVVTARLQESLTHFHISVLHTCES